MSTSGIESIKYPEWYRVERETESTINKLYTLKELGFYLRNSDEYVRRLAILRVNELKLKDSIDVLREILDDSLECTCNKELAAWTIKAISLKWDIDLYISNRLLGKYTGKERYFDIFKIIINDSIPSVKFEFNSSPLDSELQSDNNEIRSCNEIDLEMPFPFQDWFSAWQNQLLSGVKKSLENLPSKIFNSIKKVIILFFKIAIIKFPQFLYNLAIQGLKNIKFKTSRKNIVRSQTKLHKFNSINPLYLLKRIIFNVLYIMFAPLRIILKYKKYALVLILVVYCYLTFTTSGKIMAYRYTGLDFYDIQRSLIASTEDIIKCYWKEIKDVSGISKENIKTNIPEITTVSKQGSYKAYIVTARTGLNLRKGPNGNTDKVIDEILPYGSTVFYLSKSQQDSTGKLWYYIETHEGNIGWVYSKWLQETGG